MSYDEFGRLTPELWMSLHGQWVHMQEIEDRRAAMICSVLTASMGGRAVPMNKFMPDYGLEKNVDAETLKEKVKYACTTLGGIIKKE